MDIILKILIFVLMDENYYFDLDTEEGKVILKFTEEWLCSAYGSMENLDIVDIFVWFDEVFVELNIFDNGKYYVASRRIPDEWFRRHKRDCKLKEIGI
jgi:hypothetical protein